MKRISIVVLLFILLSMPFATMAQNRAAPEPFTLWFPAGNETIHSGYELFSFNWTLPQNVENITFTLDRVSPTAGNVLTLTGLTLSDDADLLTCDEYNCYIGLTQNEQALLTEGVYTWDVTASNVDGSTPSFNGPSTLRVDPDAVLVGTWRFKSPLWGQTFLSGSDLHTITWIPAPNASTYRLIIKHNDGAQQSVLDALGLTPAVDTDALTCTLDVCTYTVDAATQAQLVNGEGFDIVGEASNADDITWSADGGRYFNINSAAVLPGAFYAINPIGGKVFDDAFEVGSFMWKEPTGAVYYEFDIIRLTKDWHEWILNWAFQTPAADSDQVTCADGICTLTPTAVDWPALYPATYEWRVKAYGVDGFTIPTDGPGFVFTIDPSQEDLLANGGFELSTNNMPDGWTAATKITKDKVACDTPEARVAFEGMCALGFKGSATENVVYSQTITPGLLRNAPRANNSLTLTGYYKASGSPNLTITIKVIYVNTTVKDKLSVRLNAVSDDYIAIAGATGLTLRDDLKKVKVTLKHTSLSGKLYLDGLGLVLETNPF